MLKFKFLLVMGIVSTLMSCKQDLEKNLIEVTKGLSSKSGETYDMHMAFVINDSTWLDESFGQITFTREDGGISLSDEINSGKGIYKPNATGLGQYHEEVTFDWWLERTGSDVTDNPLAILKIDFVTPDADFVSTSGIDEETTDDFTRLIGGLEQRFIQKLDKNTYEIFEEVTLSGDELRDKSGELYEVSIKVTLSK
ncbi:MAG: hypothetical protein JXQ90_06140 [Cyclobacteriaceae bacterium]